MKQSDPGGATVTKTPDRSVNPSAIKRVRESVQSRPWQLLMQSNGSQPISFSEQAVSSLTRILDLLPHLDGLSIRTEAGDVHVSRDFSGDTTGAVDSLIATVLADDPNIRGIVFSGTGKQSEHVATRDDPHYLPAGKEFAIVRDALKAGLIDTGEALRKTKAIYKKD
jgi:hypothetical protein